MRTVDGKLTGDGKPEVRIAATKSRLLECDQSGALGIAAPDRQIPVGRSREIFDRELWPVGLMHPDPCMAGARRRRSPDLQVLGRGLAAIAHNLVFDLLAF